MEQKGYISKLKVYVKEIKEIKEKCDQLEIKIEEEEKEFNVYFEKSQNLRTVSDDLRYNGELRKCFKSLWTCVDQQQKHEEDIKKLQDYIIKMATERIRYWKDVKEHAKKGDFWSIADNN
ncbi:hypothetical protein RCL_jg29621.t1 [Rhizophagus clarus]|uniref:Uncharacterized protein n=1 Tax=Rhizophagus clarus TaxID=94130 RepID=A0A8H3L2B0_9GLOM|nr:hypothetical protein RCL_jg29621.t1 [Rhizophagus clarus]